MERHDIEQYFWTEKTVHEILKAVEFEDEGTVCCLSTPSLSHEFFLRDRAETLLDIDLRFQYLPKFRYFDLLKPLIPESEEHRIIIFDPPFFYIPMDKLFHAVRVLCKDNFRKKLLVGFLVREEATLLQTFAPFGLKKTKFILEYATVKPNKWKNYALYANVDLPGIKRMN